MASVFSVAIGWSSTTVNLRLFCPGRLPLSRFFGWRRLFFNFFLSVPFGISGLLVSPGSIMGYMRQHLL